MLFTKLLYFARLAADRRHFYSLMRMPYAYVQPRDMFERYVCGRGCYPATIGVRTDRGQLHVQIFSRHDAATLNQIFGRLDYKCPRHGRAVVDLGSNIGLSALYFLSRCPLAVVYCFEPLPRNVERLKDNIAPLSGRAVVRQQAVSMLPGRAKFWYEDTGRYGTLVGGSGPSIEVSVAGINDVLAEVLARHGHIAVLKLDVEGLEEQLLAAISFDHLAHIDAIFAEYRGPFEMPGFERKQWGFVARYLRTLRRSAGS